MMIRDRATTAAQLLRVFKGPAGNGPAVVQGLGVVGLRAEPVIHAQHHAVPVPDQYLAHLLHNIQAAAKKAAAVVIHQHGQIFPGVAAFIDSDGHRVPVGAVYRDAAGVHPFRHYIVALVLGEHLPGHGGLLFHRGVLLGLGHEVHQQRHKAHGFIQSGIQLAVVPALGDGLDQNRHAFIICFVLSLSDFVQQRHIISARHNSSSCV